MSGVTFDAGALVALDRNEREAWVALKSYLRSGDVPTIPTVATAQAWRNGARQARLSQAMKLCRQESLTEDLAREAGELCGRTGKSDVVDAAIIVSAARRYDVIVTSDRRDLDHLAGHVVAGSVTVVSVRGAR